MSKISKHITYKEATRSVTALRLGIENVPNDYELQNMELIAEKVFEPLRKAVNGPIKINSFFRCEELNKAIGGSSKSQHCQGRAIDIDDVHVSYLDSDSNRKRCLLAYKEEGKTKYKDISHV